MNNYRNYGNYGNCGNRRMPGCQDNGCGKPMAKPDCDNKCPEVKPDCDCKCSATKGEGNCGVESMYHEMKKNEACGYDDMQGKALAMAYVPWQTWRKLYEICEGFSKGTIFKELDLDFYGRRCS